MSDLYIVGTPIGNLGDITYRAAEILKTVDAVACEDTRRTLKLLNRLEIKKPLLSYYKHKEREGSERILACLAEGKDVALVSDAGMPCISDPGAYLVREAAKSGFRVTVIPGPSALTAAFALIGSENKFTFLGFLPDKKSDREQLLRRHKGTGADLVFYAAPHDVNDYLEVLYRELGNGKVWLLRELTKIHETVRNGDLASLREENPRGEYVIIVEGKTARSEVSDEEILRVLEAESAIVGNKKEAIIFTAEKLDVSKNRVYKLSLSGGPRRTD